MDGRRKKFVAAWFNTMPFFCAQMAAVVLMTFVIASQAQDTAIDWYKVRLSCKSRRTTTKKKLPKGYELTERITITVTIKNDLTSEIKGLTLGAYTITETVNDNPKKVVHKPGPSKTTKNIAIPGLNSVKIDAWEIELKRTRELYDRLVKGDVKKVAKERGVVYRGWIVTLKDSSGKLVLAKGSSADIRKLGREFKILPKGIVFSSHGLPKPEK